MPRIELVDPNVLTPAQDKIFRQIKDGPRGAVRGPFPLLLHSPGLTDGVERVGAYLRYDCPLPERVRELTISQVAAHWRVDTEWNSHAPKAIEHGVPEAVIAAIGEGRDPVFDSETDGAAFAFVKAVLASTGTNPVPADVFEAARARFGEAGLVDLAGIAGYYSLLAMALNAFEVRPQDTAGVPWRKR